MEGFTLVLVTGWIVLLGTFIGMYFLDQATKRAAARRAAPTGETSEKSR